MEAFSEARHAVVGLTAAEAEMEINSEVRYFVQNPGEKICARFLEDSAAISSGHHDEEWRVPEDKEVARLFEPARQWFDAEVTQVHSVEIATGNLEWGYAGRVDLVATLKSTGRPTVIDFRTQKTRRDKNGSLKPILHDTWPLQLEAYHQALASRDKGLQDAAIASVVIGSTEPVPVVVKVWDDADKPGFFRAFLAARDLWVWQKSYCPVKDSPDDDETPPTALVPA